MKQHKKLANGTSVTAQNRDPVIPLVKEWVNRPKEFLEGKVLDYDKRFYSARQKEFVIHDVVCQYHLPDGSRLDPGICCSGRKTASRY